MGEESFVLISMIIECSQSRKQKEENIKQSLPNDLARFRP